MASLTAPEDNREDEDRFLSPSSLRLPIDPVVADDGEIYEEISVEFKNPDDDEEIHSPSTPNSIQPKEFSTAPATKVTVTPSPASKRQRKDEDGLLGPISLGLPMVPAFADDGKMYEEISVNFKSPGDYEGDDDEMLSQLTPHTALPKESTSDTETNATVVSLPASKRQRKNEDALLCPISRALPVDPVLADDGKIYEKEYIEDYFKSQKGSKEILSPFTRKPITTRLLPSPQIKITIETLVDNGAITGSAAEDWKKRMQKKEGMDDLLNEAEEGDVDSMLLVAEYFEWGLSGFNQDHKEAYKWYEKARVAGSVPGMAKAGDFLLAGTGVEKNLAKGLLYLGMAEGRGSEVATFILGLYMLKGLFSVPTDEVEGRKLIEKSLSGVCPYKDMSPKLKKTAKAYLKHLKRKESA